MSSAALGGRPRVRPRCRPSSLSSSSTSCLSRSAVDRGPSHFRLRGCARSGGTLPGSRAAAAIPCSADAHGTSCQKLRMHYTIATLPPCTAAIFLVSARRLAQRAAANRTSFCPASACRVPPTPHSTRTVSPPRPSVAAAPLSLSFFPSFSLLPAISANATGLITEPPFRSGARHRRPTSVMELWRPRNQVPIARPTAPPRSSRASRSRSSTWRACMSGVRRTTGTLR